MNTEKGNFIPQDAEEMGYHEYLDYWRCKCKNFENWTVLMPVTDMAI